MPGEKFLNYLAYHKNLWIFHFLLKFLTTLATQCWKHLFSVHFVNQTQPHQICQFCDSYPWVLRSGKRVREEMVSWFSSPHWSFPADLHDINDWGATWGWPCPEVHLPTGWSHGVGLPSALVLWLWQGFSYIILHLKFFKDFLPPIIFLV